MSACPICDYEARAAGAVNFNKSCSDAGAKLLEPTDRQIAYELCPACGFCFAPEMMAWPVDRFVTEVYNAAYCLVDPEYVYVRPANMAEKLHAGFGRYDGRHLDYGGGNGLMARLLRAKGWDSTSFDPLADAEAQIEGAFDFITALEVFEHVPDPHALMREIDRLLDPDGMVMFTTLLSDGHTSEADPLGWWYIAPRNGHIGIFSQASLEVLADAHGFDLANITDGTHAMTRRQA